LSLLTLLLLLPLPPLLLSLLPLLLSLLPLLLAAESARAVAAKRHPGPGCRLLKLKQPRARSKTRGSNAESVDTQLYDGLLQKRAEMNNAALQKNSALSNRHGNRASAGVFVLVICSLRHSMHDFDLMKTLSKEFHQGRQRTKKNANR
jgi:hypothetical protein